MRVDYGDPLCLRPLRTRVKKTGEVQSTSGHTVRTSKSFPIRPHRSPRALISRSELPRVAETDRLRLLLRALRLRHTKPFVHEQRSSRLSVCCRR